jgi:hypothetical protein
MLFFKSKIMKTLKNLLFVAAICLAIVSCKKSDDTKPSDYPFADETVDQGKANLSAAGQEVINQIAALDTVDAMAVIQSLVGCYSNDNPFATSVSSIPVFRTLATASSLSADKNSMSYLTKSMQTDVSNDSTITQVYKRYMGIYTWNISTKKWVKTTSSSNFKFIFPSKVDGTTNDATLSFTYTGKNGFSYEDNYNGDIPTAFNISIEVNKAKVFEMDFKASYNSDWLPTSVNYFIALTPFKYELSYNYSTSDITTRMKFTNASTTISDFYFTTSGNYGMDNINSAENVNDVIYNGSAYLQIFNIKLAGELDVNKAMAINDSLELFTSAELLNNADRIAKKMNDCVKLDLVYADSKEKIASLEFYPQIDEDNKVDFNYRFIFSDGSKSDLKTYLITGFGKFSDLVNEYYNKQ